MLDLRFESVFQPQTLFVPILWALTSVDDGLFLSGSDPSVVVFE